VRKKILKSAINIRYGQAKAAKMSNNHGTSVTKDWEGTSFPAPKGTSNSST